MMRTSHSTERTAVPTRAASPSNSIEHLATLKEQNTNLSIQQQRRIVENDGKTTEADLERGDEEKVVEETHRFADEKKDKDPNLIDWDGPNDPENPQNWPARRKWIITVSMGMMTFCVTFASSVFSNATRPTAKLFNVSTEVTTLGTSLFVLGFSVGPLIWGPFSEVFGRKLPLFIGFTLFAIFQIPIAVAVNLETIMLCRFFGGCFASAPLAIVGGALADIFSALDRGVAITVFAGATFIGPIAGPIMGGFIVDSYLGWRWTAWITLIMATFFGLIGLYIIPETSHPKILQQRAKRIRYDTKNWAIHSELDTREINFKNTLNVYLLRPFHMLLLEPILFLVTIYMALIYGCLYLFFEAYPISFQEKRGWNAGVGALPFLGIAIGIFCGVITIITVTKTTFKRNLIKNGKIIPEDRLPPMIAGSILLPAGLFWFAWTSSPNISWVPQVISSAFIGWGIMMIFLQGFNYIIDVYLWYANSAIAANTFLRSLAGAGFPLFAAAMYHNLGVAWATSLLAFLNVAMIPAPILFYKYGARIRALSKFAPKV